MVPRILRTEAIVLRHLDYRETSQIVTLFTRELGKVSVIARGARAAKSPFGSALQPMAYVEAVLYHSPGRELHTLKEVAHVRPFLQLTRHLDRMAIGLRIIEFVHALSQPDEPHPALFQLVVETLSLLDAAEERPENLLLFFQLQLAGHLGFQPAVSREQVEALTEQGGSLILESGDVIEGRVEGRGGRFASRPALRAFAILVHAPVEAVLRMTMAEHIRKEVGALVDAYLHFHVEEAYPTRGEKIMGALLNRRGE
ncbi:MAG: DNA repair protein RecO [Rhodothermales bacterium]|nr:DNA repair protein RecO [Rhodothermales bacterium]